MITIFCQIGGFNMAEYTYSKILKEIKTKLEEEFEDEMSKIDFDKIAKNAIKKKGISLDLLANIDINILTDIIGEGITEALKRGDWKKKIRATELDVSDLLDLNQKEINNQIKEYYDKMIQAFDKGNEELAMRMQDGFMKAMTVAKQKGIGLLKKNAEEWLSEYDDLLTQTKSDYKLDADSDIILNNKKGQAGLTESAKKYQRWLISISDQINAVKNIQKSVSGQKTENIDQYNKSFQKTKELFDDVGQTNVVKIFDGVSEQIYDVTKDTDALNQKLSEMAKILKDPVWQAGDLRHEVVNSPNFKFADSLAFNMQHGGGSAGSGHYTTSNFEDVVDWMVQKGKDKSKGLYTLDLSNYNLLQIPSDDYYDQITDLFGSMHKFLTNAAGLKQYDTKGINNPQEIFEKFKHNFEDLHITYEDFSSFIQSELSYLKQLDVNKGLDQVEAIQNDFIKHFTKAQGLSASLANYDDSVSLGSVIYPDAFNKEHPYSIDWGGNIELARKFYDEIKQQQLELKASNLANDPEDLIRNRIPTNVDYDSYFASQKDLLNHLKEINQQAKEVDFQTINQGVLSINKAVQDGISDSLDSHSPSKEAAKQADNVVDGIINEVNDRLPEVEQIGENIGKTIVSGIKDGIEQTKKELTEEDYLAQMDAKLGYDVKSDTEEVQTQRETDAIWKKAESLKELRDQYKVLKNINHDIALYENPDNYLDTGLGKSFTALGEKKTGSGYEELKKLKKDLLELNPILNQVADSTERISKSDFEQMFGSYFETAIDKVAQAETETKIISIAKAQQETVEPDIRAEYEKTADAINELGEEYKDSAEYANQLLAVINRIREIQATGKLSYPEELNDLKIQYPELNGFDFDDENFMDKYFELLENLPKAQEFTKTQNMLDNFVDFDERINNSQGIAYLNKELNDINAIMQDATNSGQDFIVKYKEIIQLMQSQQIDSYEAVGMMLQKEFRDFKVMATPEGFQLIPKTMREISEETEKAESKIISLSDRIKRQLMPDVSQENEILPEVAQTVEQVDKLSQELQQTGNQGEVAVNKINESLQEIKEEFEILNNGDKRVLSDIGLTYEQLIEKLRKENKEIEEGNRLFEERVAYLKNGVVVDSFQGNDKEVAKAITDKQYDKIVHTHPVNSRGSGAFSYGDILRFYDNKMAMPSFSEAELFSGGSSKVILQFSELTQSLFKKYSQFYQSLQEAVSVAFGKETDYGKFIPDETITNEVASAYLNTLAKSMINSLGGDLKFNIQDITLDDTLTKQIYKTTQDFQHIIEDYLNKLMEQGISDEAWDSVVKNIYHDKLQEYRDFYNQNESNQSPISEEIVQTEQRLTETTEKANTVIEEQKQKIAELEGQVDDLRSSLKAQGDELAHANEEYSNMMDELGRANDREDLISEELTNERLKREEIEEQNKALKEQNELLEQQRKDAKADAKYYEEMSHIAAGGEAEADAQRREAMDHLLAQEKISEQLKEQTLSQEKKISALEKERDYYEEAANNGEREIANLTEALDISRSANQYLETQSSMLKEQNEELQKKLEITEQITSELKEQNKKQESQEVTDIKDVQNAVKKKNKAFQNEESVVSKAVNNEITKLKELEKVISQNIPNAIQKKNEAFVGEGNVVSAVVNDEKKAIKQPTVKNTISNRAATRAYQAQLEKFKSAIENPRNIITRSDREQYDHFAGIDISKESIENLQKYTSEMKDFVGAIEKMGNETKLRKVLKDIAKTLNDNTAMPKDLAEQYKLLESQTESLLNSGVFTPNQVQALNNQLLQLGANLEKTGKKGKSFFGMIGRDIKTSSARIIAQYLSIQDFIRYARSAVQAVTQLDSALTQLKIVSDASNESLKRISDSAYTMANALGLSTTEIVNSITEWRRLGYTIEDSQMLAQEAAKLSTGGLMDVNSATTSLISAMQAFKIGANEVGKVVDQYIYLGK